MIQFSTPLIYSLLLFMTIKSKIPSDDVPESLCKLRIRESARLNSVLELYDMEIHQKMSMPNDQKSKTMVKRSIDQKLLRNFDDRHGKIETGAVVKNRKELIGVEEGGKGTCYQKKEKGQCSKGDKCSFGHESNDRAQQKTETESRHTFRAINDTRSKCRGKEVSRAKVILGSFNRQPCRYYLKGTCTRSPCEYGHPPNVNCTKKSM